MSLMIKQSSKYEEHGAFQLIQLLSRELDNGAQPWTRHPIFLHPYHRIRLSPGTYIVTLFSPAILKLEFHLPLAAKVTLRS